MHTSQTCRMSVIMLFLGGNLHKNNFSQHLQYVDVLPQALYRDVPEKFNKWSNMSQIMSLLSTSGWNWCNLQDRPPTLFTQNYKDLKLPPTPPYWKCSVHALCAKYYILTFKSIYLFAMYPLDTIQATDWLLVWYCQQMNRWITIQLGIQSPPQGRYVTKSEPLGSLLDSNCLHWRLSAQLLGNRFCKKQTKQKHFWHKRWKLQRQVKEQRKTS